jgi:toxin YoeB
MPLSWRKLEPLREYLAGFCSKRIDDTHRIVYIVENDDLVVVACRYNYE